MYAIDWHFPRKYHFVLLKENRNCAIFQSFFVLGMSQQRAQRICNLYAQLTAEANDLIQRHNNYLQEKQEISELEQQWAQENDVSSEQVEFRAEKMRIANNYLHQEKNKHRKQACTDDTVFLHLWSRQMLTLDT